MRIDATRIAPLPMTRQPHHILIILAMGFAFGGVLISAASDFTLGWPFVNAYAAALMLVCATVCGASRRRPRLGLIGYALGLAITAVFSINLVRLGYKWHDTWGWISIPTVHSWIMAAAGLVAFVVMWRHAPPAAARLRHAGTFRAITVMAGTALTVATWLVIKSAIAPSAAVASIDRIAVTAPEPRAAAPREIIPPQEPSPPIPRRHGLPYQPPRVATTAPPSTGSTEPGLDAAGADPGPVVLFPERNAGGGEPSTPWAHPGPVLSHSSLDAAADAFFATRIDEPRSARPGSPGPLDQSFFDMLEPIRPFAPFQPIPSETPATTRTAPRTWSADHVAPPPAASWTRLVPVSRSRGTDRTGRRVNERVTTRRDARLRP